MQTTRFRSKLCTRWACSRSKLTAGLELDHADVRVHVHLLSLAASFKHDWHVLAAASNANDIVLRNPQHTLCKVVRVSCVSPRVTRALPLCHPLAFILTL